MTLRVIDIWSGAMIREAAATMRDLRIAVLPVTENKKLGA